MADLLMNKHMQSGPAIWYRVRADLRGRRLPAASVVLVVTLATLLIGLALAVFGSIQAPFDRLFTQLNGAHLWVYYFSPPTQGQLDPVAHAPNVAATTELEEATGNAYILLASQKFSAYLQTFPAQQPAIGQLLITRGHGLADNDPNGVIVGQPFADAYHLQMGNVLTLVTPQGLAQVHVRGLSIDVNHVTQSEASQPRIYLLRSTFERLYPQPDRWVIGLRLVDPYAIGPTTDTILQQLQAQGYRERFLAYDDWLSYRKDFGADSRLTAILLLAFGIVSLFAAGMIVTNLVIGQVLAQQRDLGILKALGFTPLQLVGTLVLEYLLLGLLGALAGLALVALIAPPLLAVLGASLDVPVPPHYDLGTGVFMLVAILLVIAVYAALPAWRAGRTRVVDAIRPGAAAPRGGRARLVGVMFATGLPVVVALGVRGVTARPLRTLLVLLTLLLGVMTAVFGLGFASTLDKYAHDPALNGVFADVDIQPGLYDPRATQQLVASRPEIAYYYSSYDKAAQLPGGNTFDLIFTSGDTRRIVTQVSTGRWFNAHANELVLGDSTLQDLGLRVGQQVPLVFNLDKGQQVTITYTVVGSLYATQKRDEGYAALSSLTAHTTIRSNGLLADTEYEVTLHPGISPQAFAQRMQTFTTDRIGVKVYDLTPPGGVTQGPLIMAFLSIALMLVAGVGMLNAMVLSTRERYRELASLKAIGFTPRQVLGSVINGAVFLGMLAAIIGIPLGHWLNTVVAQALSNSIGGPSHIQISANWWSLALLIPATALVAVLGAYIPARWAARVPAAEILHYE